MPIALTVAFAEDASKTTQWRAFIGRSRAVGAAPSLLEVIEALRVLLRPIFKSDAQRATSAHVWQPETGRWT